MRARPSGFSARPATMRARSGALSVVIGLSGAGLVACGTASQATAGSPGTAAASPGHGSASPTVVIMPASPATSPAHGGAGGGGKTGHGRVLTVADDGVSVQLRTGQVVAVVLATSGLMWDIPRASGNVVRRISGSGGYPAHSPAVAAFRAVRPGRSLLTSFTDAPCLHSQPSCEIPQRLWRAQIIVRNT